jgi:protein gp37
MTAFWGDETWRDAAYDKDLFGLPVKGGISNIVHAFKDRLVKVAGFAYVSEPMPMRITTQCFEVTLQPHTLEIPLTWKKSQTIFVNSMSDLFHKKVPTPFIQQVFSTMHDAHWHRFQVLKKRPERVENLDCGVWSCAELIG